MSFRLEIAKTGFANEMDIFPCFPFQGSTWQSWLTAKITGRLGCREGRKGDERKKR